MNSRFLFLLQITLFTFAIYQPQQVGTFTCPPPNKNDHDVSKCFLPGKTADAAIKIANALTRKGKNECGPNVQEACCEESVAKKNRLSPNDFKTLCTLPSGQPAEIQPQTKGGDNTKAGDNGKGNDGPKSTTTLTTTDNTKGDNTKTDNTKGSETKKETTGAPVAPKGKK